MTKSTILIIDDNAENLRVLKRVLDQPDRDVRAATSGPPALALAQKHPVDLVLLDINMPGMDGYEVCRRLKEHPSTREIPVLFLSANTETEDIVKGFAIGGADYITKPFEIAEVEARVDTHLKLSRLQSQLARHNETLEATVQSRTAELREANAKLALLDGAKNDFFRLISHEVRTPLNGMVALEVALSDVEPKDDPMAEAHGLFLGAFRRMVEIVDHAMILTEFQVGPAIPLKGSCQIGDTLLAALEEAAPIAAEFNIALPERPARSPWFAPGKTEHHRDALAELLKATIKLGTPGTTLSIEFASERTLLITAHGNSFTDEEIATLFEICGSRLSVSNSFNLGLGPCVAHQLFNYLGVSLRTQSPEGDGITFRLDYHAATAEAPTA